MADQITLLQHSSLLTKKWYLDAHGKPKQDAYGFAKTFQCQVIDLDGPADLYELLDVLATEPHRCVIRGAPIPGRDMTSILRRAKAKGAEPACFTETPRRWVMLDLDLLDTSLRADYTTPQGCIDAVHTALACLPAACRSAGAWWQLSSSAGFKSGIRLHIWYWLDRAIGGDELKRWAETANEAAGKVIIDAAVFNTVQIHYTAAPIFDGVVDLVVQRTGRLDGPPLVLPRLAARAGAWRQKLLPLANPNNTCVHVPVRDACAAYFCVNGPDAPVGVLAVALRQAVDASCAMRGVTETKYTDEKLAEYIADGKAFAATRAAVGENLVLATDGTPKASVSNINAILQSSAVWRELVGFNSREGAVWILRDPPWGGVAPRPWADEDSVEAATWIGQEYRMACDDAPVYRAVLTLAHKASFDPLVDWLNSLVWDGTPRLSNWLVRWCRASDTPYNTKVSRMWPISAIARALAIDPNGSQTDTVMVLQGATGVRKTSLFRLLGGDYYASVIDSKDMVQKIHGPWIVEFPELGPFTSADVNLIKSFVDQKTDRYREPYARLPTTRPRRCVIVATTNETQWQEDATSARRFWPVDVGMIDLDLAARERDQLWAEAVVAYRAGEVWFVEANDPDFTAIQEIQYATDPWQEQIAQGLAQGCSNYAGSFIVTIAKGATTASTYEVLVGCLGNTRQTKRDQVRVAKCLRKLGWLPAGAGRWSGPSLTAGSPPARVKINETNLPQPN
jgi:predicted P-loop ATPase